MRTAAALIILILLTNSASMVEAQAVQPATFSNAPHIEYRTATPALQQVRQSQGSVARPLLFGALFGASGFVAGALLGDAATEECDNSSDICIADAVFYGAAAGGTLGMAFGVHLGNRRQGNFPLDFLSAAAVWALGIATVTASDSETADAVVLVAIPVVQLGVTLGVERATRRSGM